MKVAIYARVSSSGQELEQQLAECRRYCDYKQHQVAAEYADTGSGVRFNRPQFQAMLAELRRGRYQGVVVFRIDRLGRRARDLALVVDELEGRGVHVFSVREQFDTSTAMGRAMREMCYIMAQLERENISEATRERLGALRASGKRLGRPPLKKRTRELVTELAKEGKSYRYINRVTGVSIGTISKMVKKEQNDGR